MKRPAMLPACLILMMCATTAVAAEPDNPSAETAAGWVKSAANPVLGGELGTCFDVSLLKEGDLFRMWFSWRPKKSVALVESRDGIHWSEPVIVLGPDPATGWEDDMNRPVVVQSRRPLSHVVYRPKRQRVANRLRDQRRRQDLPPHEPAGRCSRPRRPWEQADRDVPARALGRALKCYRMWYSAGERNEPDAIGYATSPDGLRWTRWREQSDLPARSAARLGEAQGDRLPGRASRATGT